jgi:hypothetical protein
MSKRIELAIDKQGRMSVGRLGLSEGFVVAEEMEDQSGWVIRPARVMTQADLDIHSSPSNLSDLDKGLTEAADGRTVPSYRR